VICPLEDYILTGTEFSKCQKEVLKSFSTDDSSSAPCNELKHVVDNCAKIVQRCFTERGWERGKLVFMDLLALQFPKHNHCDVFVNRNDSKIPQKLTNEKCSVVEEVALLTQMRLCNNEAQSATVKSISHHKVTTSQIDNTTESILYFAYPELCKGLQNVTDSCFKNNLQTCYDAHDALFHYAYMLEELKTAGIILSLHLLPRKSGVDVLECPVFQETDPFYQASKDHQKVFIFTIILSLLVFALFTFLAVFATLKLRLIPRFGAWIQNKPYEDIVIAEATVNTREMSDLENEENQRARVAAEEQLPSVHVISVPKSSNVSMVDLRREESSVQST